MPFLSYFKFVFLLSLKVSFVISQKLCSPLQSTDFTFDCKFELSPSYGPEVGGTVVRINSVASCPITNEADIFCRFKGSAFSQIFPGTRVSSSFECLTPFSGQATNVEVSFTVIPNDCEFDHETAEWFDLDENFQYIGDRAGVVVRPDFSKSSSMESSSKSPQSFGVRVLQQNASTTPPTIDSSFGPITSIPLTSTNPISSPTSTSPTSNPTVTQDVGPMTSIPTSATSTSPIFSPTTTSPISTSTGPFSSPTVSPSSISSVDQSSSSPITDIPFTSNPTQTPSSTQKVIPHTLIVAGTPQEVMWSSDALRLSAGDDLSINYKLSRALRAKDLKVKVEILAYNNTASLTSAPAFQVIQSSNFLSKLVNSTVLEVEDNSISDFLIDDWGIIGQRIAIILVRVVIYSNLNNEEQDHTGNLILATRSSKLIGVLPESAKAVLEDEISSEESDGRCPIAPREICSDMDYSPLCPPSYGVAENDFRFTPDEICSWPSGNSVCDPNIDLLVDNVTTCLSYEGDYQYDYIREYSEVIQDTHSNIDCGVNLTAYYEKVESSDGCECSTYHPGANGCVRSGTSQCCYSGSGALISQVEDGGGSAKCFRSDSTRLETIGHFLYDILPFQYCCLLNNECESYQRTLSTITDDGYVNPLPSARIFGDPHLTTFDDLDYDFNGLGEYVAFCTSLTDQNMTTDDLLQHCSPSAVKRVPNRGILSVHYRFDTLRPGHRGTATRGVAMEDPLFRNGEHAIVVKVNNDTNVRLDLFNGDNLVTFPSAQTGQLIMNIAGATITKTANTERRFFIMTIHLPSGLSVKIVETAGVINPTITRPTTFNNVIGLLGRPDDVKSNDFTDSSGNVLDVFSGTSSRRRALLVNQYFFNTTQTRDIFFNFGQSWMIRYQDASLFNQDFSDFFRTCYIPWFEVDENTESPIACTQSPSPKPSSKSDIPTPSPTPTPTPTPTKSPTASPTVTPTVTPTTSPTARPSASPSKSPILMPSSVVPSTSPTAEPSVIPSTASVPQQRKLQSNNEVDEICGDVEDDFIRQACIFDYAVTGDAALVRATTAVAIIEEENAAILTNTPPNINGGRNHNASVGIAQPSSFEIIAIDSDGNNVTAFLERNDNNLFVLSTRAEGLFELYFNGSGESGNFKGQVVITDGLTPVLFTGTVNVTKAISPSPTPVETVKSKKSKSWKKSNTFIGKRTKSKDLKSVGSKKNKN